jgi:hypothetical protein
MPQKKILSVILLILFCCGGVLVILSIPSFLTQMSGGYTGEQLGPPGGTVMIVTRDSQNQTPLFGVDYYINGLFAGTSPEGGPFVISLAGYPSGLVSVRAVKEGYREKTIRVDLTKTNPIVIDIQESDIIPVLITGSPESRINIVFLPSNTSFNSTTNTKVFLKEYPGGRPKFAADVLQFVNQTFGRYPSVMSQDPPRSENYLDKFNFYYFWDGKTYADAFDGCAGKIPDSYWKEMTYSDLTVILYPGYYGMYLGPPSLPMGCTNPNGLGRVYLKIAANQPYLAMHEIGHGLYGLMDTYCGDTYYNENDPNPNVWNSDEKCRAAAHANNWNPDNCRQIQDPKNGCQKDVWRWDPDPDIMYSGYYGNFGNASTTRILTILNKY